MSTILFYSPFNQRSRDTESLMIAFHRQGHRVISLSQAPGLLIHDFLRKHGIETDSYIASNRVRWFRHIQHIRYLVRFCKRNKVQIVYSHLESANFIASLAQFFIDARVYLCRHHSDQYHLLHRDLDWSYKITYRLARRIIVFSETSRNYMIASEGVAEGKITEINLAYDFSLYPKPVPENVERIRKALDSPIILITVGNLNPLKRPETSVLLLKSLHDRGYNAKLILLGSGELKEQIQSLIEKLNLTGKVIMPGYVDNVLEYLAAATFLIHPSVSESSCVVVKEAGLAKIPVVVCREVGDFDSLIVDGVNGFLIEKDRFVEEATTIIERMGHKKDELHSIGVNLEKSVIEQFSVDHVLGHYDSLNTIQ